MNFVKFFTSDCTSWEGDATSRKYFLNHIVDRCQELVKYRGYLFVSEIDSILGCALYREDITHGWFGVDTIVDIKIKNFVWGEALEFEAEDITNNFKSVIK